MKKIKIAGLMLVVFAFNGYATDKKSVSLKEFAHELVKNGIYYDGKKDPENMPKYAVMMTFVERIVSLDTDLYAKEISAHIFNQIGIDEEKIEKIKTYSREALAEADEVSKEVAVCNYVVLKGKAAKRSRVADIINSKDKEKRGVFMDAYKKIGKILSDAEMARFEQYLITYVATGMTYIVSRELLAEAVNMKKYSKYCY